jgi:hypothetical protein
MYVILDKEKPGIGSTTSLNSAGGQVYDRSASQLQLANCSSKYLHKLRLNLMHKPLYTLYKGYLVQCTDKGCAEPAVISTPRQRGYARAESTSVTNVAPTLTHRPLLPRRRGGPISKHVHVWKRERIRVMFLGNAEVGNNCTGKGQQQFNRPTHPPYRGSNH